MADASLDKYQCLLCSYIYDPLAGDHQGNIPQGIPFEDLPDTWVCPVCGAGKDQFAKIEEKKMEGTMAV